MWYCWKAFIVKQLQRLLTLPLSYPPRANSLLDRERIKKTAALVVCSMKVRKGI